jgi:hypothetical protein
MDIREFALDQAIRYLMARPSDVQEVVTTAEAFSAFLTPQPTSSGKPLAPSTDPNAETVRRSQPE